MSEVTSWTPSYTDAICKAIVDMDIDRGEKKGIVGYEVDTDDGEVIEISGLVSDNITSHYKSNGITPEEWHGYRNIHNLIIMHYNDEKEDWYMVDTQPTKKIENSINKKLKSTWKY